MNWHRFASRGYSVCYTLFIAFALMFIFDVTISLRGEREHSRRGGGWSSLASAPRAFASDLRTDSRQFPVEEIVKTRAWEKLEETIEIHADRITLVEEQYRQERRWLSYLYLGCAIGMMVFSRIARRTEEEAPGLCTIPAPK
jgi:hypothetical protein